QLAGELPGSDDTQQMRHTGQIELEYLDMTLPDEEEVHTALPALEQQRPWLRRLLVPERGHDRDHLVIQLREGLLLTRQRIGRVERFSLGSSVGHEGSASLLLPYAARPCMAIGSSLIGRRFRLHHARGT